MWKQNLLLAVASLVGVVAVAGMLMPRNRLPQPTEFDPNWLVNNDAVDTLNRVNQEFHADWELQQLETSERASDYKIARRVSLALTGTIPSLEELRTYEAQPEEQRIEWLLSHLFEDQRYADYVAERLARSFVGTEDGPFILYRRRRFVTWLSEELAKRTPYDEIVRELLTDNGLWTDSPAVNFMTVTTDQNGTGQPDPIRLAARTSRAFLGMRIDCLQCHDDNLGTITLGSEGDERDGMQQDFHQLAAFFSEVGTTGRGIQEAQPGNEYVYTFLHEEEEETVNVSVPYRPDLLPPSGTRRDRLAGWVTHEQNLPFARAIVNRTWAIMSGKPLSAPIDDIPLHDTLPPGFDILAHDLIDHGYDLQRLIRLIVYSDAFQRDSIAEFTITPEHEKAWAVFPATRLRPEQVAGSMIQSSTLSTIDSTSAILTRLARFGQEAEFVNRYGDRGEEEFSEQTGTIPQKLLMMNGNLVAERTSGEDIMIDSIGQLANLSPDAETAVRSAFLTVLTRLPTESELSYFAERMEEDNGDKRMEVMEDLFWILYNSPDFAWNH